MKKEIALHFLAALVFFTLTTLVKGYLNLSFWPFWVGAIIGTILPDVDHLMYVYLLNPQDLTSQRVNYMIGKRELFASWNLLASTRSERTELILHTAIFQVIFVVLAFLVITSSGSIFGRGIVLAFLLHLLVDEVVDLKSTGGIANWLRQVPIVLDKMQIDIYLIVNFVILIIFGFLL